MAVMWALSIAGSCGALGLCSSLHSLLVVMFLVPLKIKSPMKVIEHPLDWKIASYPASHIRLAFQWIREVCFQLLERGVLVLHRMGGWDYIYGLILLWNYP